MISKPLDFIVAVIDVVVVFVFVIVIVVVVGIFCNASHANACSCILFPYWTFPVIVCIITKKEVLP